MNPLRPTLSRQGTALLLIDVQEKLVPTMPPDDVARCLKHCRWLIETAKILGLPVHLTEQYAKGLGPTVQPLRQALGPQVLPIDKVAFSCADVPSLVDTLRAEKIHRLIVAGMETHICVLLSTMGLVAQGFEIWVARDACASRTAANWHAGLHACEQAGASVVPTETLMFLLLGRAGSAEFKQVSGLLKES